jgi:CheY-like chemotaxis protein
VRKTTERRILIVEDDPLWQASLTALLRREDVQVSSAFDYSDALNKLRQLTPLPLLAIVDLELPTTVPQSGFDGLEVLTAVRDKGIYAIVLSGHVRQVAESISKRPEVRDLVDKLRFTSEGFDAFFVAKVNEAVAYSEEARWAEGKMPDQQERLLGLPPRS